MSYLIAILVDDEALAVLLDDENARPTPELVLAELLDGMEDEEREHIRIKVVGDGRGHAEPYFESIAADAAS